MAHLREEIEEIFAEAQERVLNPHAEGLEVGFHSKLLPEDFDDRTIAELETSCQRRARSDSRVISETTRRNGIITKIDAEFIRRAVRGGTSRREMARRFGVAPITIQRLISGTFNKQRGRVIVTHRPESKPSQAERVIQANRSQGYEG